MKVFAHHHSGGHGRGDHVTALTYLKALATLLFVTAVIAAGAGIVTLAFSKILVAVLNGVAAG